MVLAPPACWSAALTPSQVAKDLDVMSYQLAYLLT
jgi:hypothetical protein